MPVCVEYLEWSGGTEAYDGVSGVWCVPHLREKVRTSGDACVNRKIDTCMKSHVYLVGLLAV